MNINAKATREKELTEELNRIIKQLININVQKVILFGSLATGNITMGSDIDCIALFDDNNTFKNRMKATYQHIDSREGIDILAYNFAEFNRLKDTPFFKHIQEHSKVVYERS